MFPSPLPQPPTVQVLEQAQKLFPAPPPPPPPPPEPGSNAPTALPPSPALAFIEAQAALPHSTDSEAANWNKFRCGGGRYCFVAKCHNNQMKHGGPGGIKFHSFPKDPERRLEWSKAIRRKGKKPGEILLANDNDVVCSEHFVDGKRSNDPKSLSYTPSIFPTHTIDMTAKIKAITRQERLAKREKAAMKGALLPLFDKPATKPATKLPQPQQMPDSPTQNAALGKTILKQNRDTYVKDLFSEFKHDLQLGNHDLIISPFQHGRPEKNNKSIACHKLLLAAKSTFMAEMLSPLSYIEDVRIILADCSEDAFDKLSLAMYDASCSEEHQELFSSVGFCPGPKFIGQNGKSTEEVLLADDNGAVCSDRSSFDFVSVNASNDSEDVKSNLNCNCVKPTPIINFQPNDQQENLFSMTLLPNATLTADGQRQILVVNTSPGSSNIPLYSVLSQLAEKLAPKPPSQPQPCKSCGLVGDCLLYPKLSDIIDITKQSPDRIGYNPQADPVSDYYPDIMPLLLDGKKICKFAICRKCHWLMNAKPVITEEKFTPHVCAKAECVSKSNKKDTEGKKKNKCFQCEICGKTFPRMGVVMRHLREQHQENPGHICDLCGTVLKNKYGLNSHVKKVHETTKEKTIPCETCGQKFRTKGVLRVHIMQHTGERPLLCELCGKGFIQCQNCKQHVKLKHGVVIPKGKNIKEFFQEYFEKNPQQKRFENQVRDDGNNIEEGEKESENEEESHCEDMDASDKGEDDDTMDNNMDLDCKDDLDLLM